LAGRDIVVVQPACDLAEAGSLCVFTADASDYLGRECRLAAGWRRSPPLGPRLLAPVGEVALELARRISRAPHSVFTVAIVGTTRRSSVARLTPSACAACSRV